MHDPSAWVGVFFDGGIHGHKFKLWSSMDEMKKLKSWLIAIVAITLALATLLYLINLFFVRGSILWADNLIAFPAGAACAVIVMRMARLSRSEKSDTDDSPAEKGTNLP